MRAGAATIVLLTVVLFALGLPYLIWGSTAEGYAVGGLAGVPSGFLLAVLVSWVTGPSLVVKIAPSEYDGQSDGYWIHLIVNNRSRDLFGNGTARDVTGRVRFGSMREVALTWKGRPNPVRDLPIPFPDGRTIMVKFADPLLFEQKRLETIRPQDPDEKWLDVAWRPKTGDGDAFVSVPEQFRGAQIIPLGDLKLGEGDHPFWLRLEYAGGESRRFCFVLVNRKERTMRTQSLYIRPATREERKMLLSRRP